MSAYGIPYKGGKSKIVKWVINCLPSNEHFYDLFCGGCSVTHYAMLSRRWQQYNINDLNGMMPQMFVDAAHGKFANEDRWISRDDFFKLKDNDGYVAVCFSFGTNLRNYAYNPHNEMVKHAAHMAIMFSDYSYLKDLWGYDFNEIEKATKIHERYLIYKRLALQMIARPDVQHLEGLSRLQSLESLERLQSLQSLQSCNDDYQEIKILPHSTVYCDIPYKGTDGYQRGGFNHDRFYEWADSRDYPVFISEYSMPDEFAPIATIGCLKSICASKPTASVEKIFVQRRYAKQYQRDLFPDY